MQFSTHYFRSILPMLLMVGFQACTHQTEEFPVPVSKTVMTSAKEVQAWYETTYPNVQPLIAVKNIQTEINSEAQATTPPTAASATQYTLAWGRAITLGADTHQITLVPIVGGEAIFANSSFKGIR
ncbi:MAG TPA: hypothetical protein VF598_11615 [Hymenobacter sp.]|jgi:hypothetical protein